MTNDIRTIESALETEQNTMVRQRLLKQRWKLNKAAMNSEKETNTSQGERSRRQNESNAA